MVISVRSTSNHLQQRLLRGEVLSLTQEKRKTAFFISICAAESGMGDLYGDILQNI